MAPMTRRNQPPPEPPQPPQQQPLQPLPYPLGATEVPGTSAAIPPDWPCFQLGLVGAQENLNIMPSELGRIPNQFQRWDSNISTMMANITTIMADITTIKTETAEIKAGLKNLTTHLSVTEARRWNASQNPSVVVAIVNGVQPPPGFPATKAEFFTLAASVVDAYLSYYSLPVDGSLEAKRQRLGAFLRIFQD